MSRALAVLGLVAALALGAALRWQPAAGHHLPPEAALEDGTRWLVDDPDACYHLRRTELALATGRTPLADRFLGHPHGSPIPWPPLFDAVLAGAAELALARPDGPAETGGVAEPALEAFAARAPVALGLLTVLAVFAAAFALLPPSRARAPAAALAALCYATLPSAVWYGGVARVDHHVFVALLLALFVACVARACAAPRPVDATVAGLAAGLVAGGALLTWLASAVFVGVGGAALFVASLSPDRERAAGAQRAGLLMLLAATVVVLGPAAESPWNAVRPGSLLELTEGVPRALAAACAPFVVLAVLRDRGPRLARAGVAVAVLAGVVALLPGFVEGARAGFAWASRGNAFMDVVEESRPLLGDGPGTAWLGVARDLGWAGYLLPAALLALAPTARRPERLLLLALAVAFLALTLTQRRFANSLAVPMALALAVPVADLAASARPALRRVGLAAGVLVALAATATGALGLRVPAAEFDALLEYRREVVSGLRRMRAGTPPAGAWNAPSAAQGYGVLAPWGLGHAIEYHARRPSIATNFGSFVGEAGFTGHARALTATTPDEFVAALRELDALYVVVRARDVSGLLWTARTAGWDAERRRGLTVRGERGKRWSELALRTALVRLALHDRAVGDRSYPGLELVWRSDRLEAASGAPPRPGEAAGPVLSIYRRLE